MFCLHRTNFERWTSSGITGFGGSELYHTDQDRYDDATMMITNGLPKGVSEFQRDNSFAIIDTFSSFSSLGYEKGNRERGMEGGDDGKEPKRCQATK
jgi:hypothetical protein